MSGRVGQRRTDGTGNLENCFLWLGVAWALARLSVCVVSLLRALHFLNGIASGRAGYLGRGNGTDQRAKAHFMGNNIEAAASAVVARSYS